MTSKNLTDQEERGTRVANLLAACRLYVESQAIGDNICAYNATLIRSTGAANTLPCLSISQYSGTVVTP